MKKYLARSKDYPEDKVIEVDTLKQLAKQFNPKNYELYQLIPAFPTIKVDSVWVPKVHYSDDKGVTVIDGDVIYDTDPTDRNHHDIRYVAYRCNDVNKVYIKTYLAFLEYFMEVRNEY